MTSHAYCFLMSFSGVLAALGVVAFIAHIKAAYDEYCRSDYVKEQRK